MPYRGAMTPEDYAAAAQAYSNRVVYPTVRTTPSWAAAPTAQAAPAAPSYGVGGQAYAPWGLANMTSDVLNQVLGDAHFWASLGLQREEAERMARQWQQSFDWQKQLDIANMLLQQQLATGRIMRNPILTQSGAVLPGYSNALYEAIWRNRPDLKEFYDRTWGAGNYTISQAIEDWIRMTDEDTVREVGRDALRYAVQQGWYTPQEADEIYQNTLQRDIAEWQRELDQQRLGLQYMQSLASMRGPRDWLSYAEMQRLAQGTKLPSWLQSLANMANMPMPQVAPSTAQQAAAQAANVQGGPEMAAPAMTPAGNAPVAAFSTRTGTRAGTRALPRWVAPPSNLNYAQTTEPIVAGRNQGLNIPLPTKVHAREWLAATPSEREMLAGAVEYAGGSWEDYQDKMLRMFPRRKVRGITYF